MFYYSETPGKQYEICNKKSSQQLNAFLLIKFISPPVIPYKSCESVMPLSTHEG